MSTQDSNRDAAERLKVLGNKLHQNGEYQGAYAKYSEAIQKDSKNAILYANRAASSLALKKYGAFFLQTMYKDLTPF